MGGTVVGLGNAGHAGLVSLGGSEVGDVVGEVYSSLLHCLRRGEGGAGGRAGGVPRRVASFLGCCFYLTFKEF